MGSSKPARPDNTKSLDKGDKAGILTDANLESKPASSLIMTLRNVVSGTCGQRPGVHPMGRLAAPPIGATKPTQSLLSFARFSLRTHRRHLTCMDRQGGNSLLGFADCMGMHEPTVPQDDCTSFAHGLQYEQMQSTKQHAPHQHHGMRRAVLHACTGPEGCHSSSSGAGSLNCMKKYR